jgi:hypothetical protein
MTTTFVDIKTFLQARDYCSIEPVLFKQRFNYKVNNFPLKKIAHKAVIVTRK